MSFNTHVQFLGLLTENIAAGIAPSMKSEALAQSKGM
jgi:hypothetical protein